MIRFSAPLVVAATLSLVSFLAVCPTALAVKDIDNAADMKAKLVDDILGAATLSMRDTETGLPEPQNTAVIVPDPINENEMWVGIFKKGVRPSSFTRQSSGE